MRFLLKMARREIRASWLRLVYFFVCIAIGVGAIVAVRSAIRNFNHALVADARSMLGADVQIDSTRPWTPDVQSRITRLTAEKAVKARTETIEAATMIRPVDPNRQTALMIELKGVEPGYPFYGKLVLSRNRQYNPDLLSHDGVLVAPAVITRLGVQEGDRVKIGDSVFTIRGLIEAEPGGGSSFRFGPRVLIERKAVEAAGLTGFGSRARRKILLKVSEGDVERITASLRKNVKNNFVNVRSFRESQENINQEFTRAENFLALTGLVILVLGGIGISSVMGVFLEQKRKAIAVLKCLGATGKRITAIYITQILVLGAAGSLAGIALARGGLSLVRTYYAQQLPENVSYALQPGAVIQGFLFGILISLLFSALPLLRIRHIKPNLLLQEGTLRAIRGQRFRPDRLTITIGTMVVAGLIALASWQGGSLRVGAYFMGGLLGASGILYLAASLLIWLVSRARKFSSFPVKHAITGLHRPGNQTKLILLAVGLGAFFITTIYSVQSNLLRELDFSRRTNMANMYLIDIQTDQKQAVQSLLQNSIRGSAQLLPTIRARIAEINGRPLDPESAQYKRDAHRLGFEYSLTYRDHLDPTETIIGGKFWTREPSSRPEVSIEESIQGMMGIDIGGTITFDIAGRRITAKVTSVRRVDWHNARTGFYILFRPGSLETAPQMYIAAINAPTTEPTRSRFQRSIVDHFPNITIIDVQDILKDVKRIIDTVTTAISFVGGFILFNGILILIGSISMTRFQRIYESAVLKTLGAKRKTMMKILGIEYTLLGCIAGVVGLFAGLALSYFIGRYVFEIPWHSSASLNLISIALTTLLVLLVGAAANWSALNQKPLRVLSAEQ